jgi:zinc protease
VAALSEKWFGPIPAGNIQPRQLTAEPAQREKRTLDTSAHVPADALYKAYHMPGRFHPDYYAVEMLNDILSNGQSSRLIHKLVKEKEIFTSLSSHTMGSLDPGLWVVSGRVSQGVSLIDAEKEIDQLLEDVVTNGVRETELNKVKNQAESMMAFDEVDVMNRAMNLAFAALSGDPHRVNHEADMIRAVTTADVQRMAGEIFKETNSSVLYYRSNPK